VVRRGHLEGVVGAFPIGCSVVAVIGRAGVGAEAPRGEQGGARAGRRQERPEAAKGQEKTPSAARIVCLRRGRGTPPPVYGARAPNGDANGDALTRVPAPEAAARPDGARVRTGNRPGKGASYCSTDPSDTTHAAFGVPVPEGKSDRVALLPPAKPSPVALCPRAKSLFGKDKG
jgi:hypothetical protein